ncbi:survival protein sure-like phosphatase/nucleotidase [Zychaea mexicana]|uniref:survival protein sure-like phosphatase/nucleotidase n=1 Tax=Zychaea mexicana TaxID=64656 RepID=UPI0022FE75F7|nr:survival protein sure-like phosphatase/nucleotidase [Zychaea mexicana]KAI9496599.1 survival protein sure-like phosphatase/nucleotidase [Zychaea mexicana]
MTERPLKVLISNDDGPPSREESPFILPFIEHLEGLGWDVKVCLPNAQKSWISKSFMIKDHIDVSYYHRDTGEISYHRRNPSDFVLLNSTPATCVNIALNYIFKDEQFDLVLGGPNFGRNTSTVYTLSSGTIGAALEAVMCKQKSIALSFAIFERNFGKKEIQGSIEMAVDIIRQLYKVNQWPEDGLFNVNIPLSAEKRPVYLTTFNKMHYGNLFKPLPADKIRSADPSKPASTEEPAEQAVRKTAEGQESGRLVFHFAPDFTGIVFPTNAPEGTDAWAMNLRYCSVTPMVASYEMAKTNVDYGFKVINKL